MLVLAGVLVLAAVGMVLQAAPKRAAGTVALPKPNFIHHLHPPSIPMPQSRFRYTLGAGGIAVFLCLVLLVTGLLEMYFYIPSVEHAATSIEVITTLVPFGNLVRNLHYWSAQLLLVVITIHLLRVVLTGAYARPRRFNFLLGLALLVLILFLDFTGYVLRWDEGIRWALVVGTNLLKTIPWIGEGLYQFVMGGPEAGPATLTRFYAWHIFGLTIGAAILIGWHAFRVRRDGGIAVPPPDRTRRQNTHHTLRIAAPRSTCNGHRRDCPAIALHTYSGTDRPAAHRSQRRPRPIRARPGSSCGCSNCSNMATRSSGVCSFR